MIRSRVEVVLLWAQLILVLGDAVSIAQGLVDVRAKGVGRLRRGTAVHVAVPAVQARHLGRDELRRNRNG